jgi:hypothetical protein
MLLESESFKFRRCLLWWTSALVQSLSCRVHCSRPLLAAAASTVTRLHFLGSEGTLRLNCPNSRLIDVQKSQLAQGFLSAVVSTSAKRPKHPLPVGCVLRPVWVILRVVP